MFSKSFLAGLLLAITAVRASPLQGGDGESHLKERDSSNLLDTSHSLGEIVRVKRDAALEPRDLELAEMHNVNLTMMYKHSIIKRDDGDHITIWVDNGFEENVGPKEGSLDKRQKAGLYRAAHFHDTPNDECREHRRFDWTSKNAPTTGGIIALRQWAWDHYGAFGWGEAYGGSAWRNVLVAGSNAGTNACYRARVDRWERHSVNVRIGTADVAADADFTMSLARNYDGKWRASSYGYETCGGPGQGGTDMKYEVRRTDDPVY
ncbi:hypothetical protein B0I35DRAFT_484700 [Stachybotrys elegans]|uniref:Ecp2 effector protein domain-containing protein n=1 Tax=Stachybotrys elegans TaxID=80388 RepID=A0A8K0SER3_9HYPO|nr:hypothetical protein B0I35DRAFT_484700 [Stachybotrys elegans]